jgi:hypothetical protein
VLNARSLLLEKLKSQKLSVAASEFSSAGAKFHATRQARLSFLVCIEPIVKTRTRETRVGIPYSTSRAITLTYIVHLPRPRIGKTCCLCRTIVITERKETLFKPRTLSTKAVGICMHWTAGRASPRPVQQHRNNCAAEERPKLVENKMTVS